ncbi:Troponin C [Porites harrisoni]
MENLSEYHLADYWDAFQYFDKDNSGFITTKELGNLMRSLGENPTENELQSIINVVDMDENGVMDFQEFVQLMSKKNQYGLDATEAKEAFRIFDRDDRGYVLTSELRQAFRSLEEDIPESELDEILEDKYQSGNRKISFEEFKKMTRLDNSDAVGAKKNTKQTVPHTFRK